jgi:hypothetical protein
MPVLPGAACRRPASRAPRPARRRGQLGRQARGDLDRPHLRSRGPVRARPRVPPASRSSTSAPSARRPCCTKMRSRSPGSRPDPRSRASGRRSCVSSMNTEPTCARRAPPAAPRRARSISTPRSEARAGRLDEELRLRRLVFELHLPEARVRLHPLRRARRHLGELVVVVAGDGEAEPRPAPRMPRELGWIAKARTPITTAQRAVDLPDDLLLAALRSSQGASVITMKPRLSRPPVPAMEKTLVTSPASRSGPSASSISRILALV